MLSLLSCAAYALPTGGQVSAGQGGIASSGNAMTVSQQSQNLAINWQSFSIGANESVNFIQPNSSSIALNRVLGADSSQIFGKLSANGQVWLLNPNGVLFGSTAQVNVGGLVASTLNISDADFLAGKRAFNGNGGTVVNQGSITAADGGYVAMLGGKVSNEGTIQARLGSVALGAGSQITLDFAGDKLLNLQVDQGVVDALAENKQLIQADGGLVLLSARAADTLVGTVVNNSGVIEARTIDASAGTIRLVGGKEGGTVHVGGTLDASAPNGGNGGFIETSGASVKVADDVLVTTSAPFGNTGTWLIDPVDFNIAASGGDVTGGTLANQLNTTNVTIRSSEGTTPGVGDINVNDMVNWDSANSLTLSALHSVNVNQPITNGGSGGVTLRADNTGACVAGATACGTVNFSEAGHVTVNGGAVNIYYNPVGSSNAADANGNGPSYATPTDYSADVTLGDGSTLAAWMLVNDVNQLQAINTNLGGDYALGRDVCACVTETWNGGAGFVPLGTELTPFTGHFDGANHIVDGLTINRPDTDNVGLFGFNSGTIANVGMYDAYVVGRTNVGGLAGVSFGPISNSYVRGSVHGSRDVGGLVGMTRFGGTVTHSYSTAYVTASDGVAGGLVGFSRAFITDSYATGRVAGAGTVGGLVGVNFELISNSFATGDVSGIGSVGGLAGDSDEGTTIRNSYATGNVSGNFSVGGLVGQTYQARIIDSYATGGVSGDSDVGGLVGHSFNSIFSNVYATGNVWSGGPGFFNSLGNIGGLVGSSYHDSVFDSHATGNVVGGARVGGLVGYSEGRIISNSYATGQVSGENFVGGLVGLNYTPISDSYATGDVTGSAEVGGLVGFNAGTIIDSYATGDVSSSLSYAGGLVGLNDTTGTITDAYATGNVMAWGAGGLVGQNLGTVQGSHATGDIRFSKALAGGLVADNRGTVRDSYATGSVESFVDSLGGLVGTNSGVLSNVFATGDVIGDSAGPGAFTPPSMNAGGLVGYNAGIVDHAYATGAVHGAIMSGGLVGRNAGAISNSFATGEVAFSAFEGGLVGDNEGSIQNAFATGSVRSPLYSADGLQLQGGLVAKNTGTIEHTHATGDVTGNTDVGGLVGFNAGTISESFATGDVTGSNDVGGLVGENTGLIINTYSTGGAHGITNVGGLVGLNCGTIETSYSTGAVTGTSYVGGLVGRNFGTVIDSYWDVTTSGQTTSAGGTGLTDKQMKRRKSFVGFDFENVWFIFQGRSYPQLRAFGMPSRRHEI